MDLKKTDQEGYSYCSLRFPLSDLPGVYGMAAVVCNMAGVIQCRVYPEDEELDITTFPKDPPQSWLFQALIHSEIETAVQDVIDVYTVNRQGPK